MFTVRDQARREALKHNMVRRNNWLVQTKAPSISSASSDADRQEMLAMVCKYFTSSLNIYDENHKKIISWICNKLQHFMCWTSSIK